MKQLYIFFLLLFFVTVHASGDEILVPSATINASVNSVCVGGSQPVITFTGSGGTAPYTFTYKIGTGTEVQVSSSNASDNDATVNVPVTAAGTFVYTLVSVKDSSVAPLESLNLEETVVVNPKPVVSFTSNASATTCSATAVNFNSAVTVGTPPFTYEWNFGGDGTSTQANPSHAFNALGCGTRSYSVSLKVTDSNGCESVMVSQNVTVKERPDINFKDNNSSFNPFNNCQNAAANPVYSISVGNVSSSSCIVSYSINWGDGSPIQNNATFPATHTYNQLGAYNMVITATGTNGCTDSKNYVIKNVSNPSGGITSPGSTQNLCAPTSNLQFAISNWGTNSPGTTYEVDYGDNTQLILLTQEQLVASSSYNSTNPANSANYPVPHSYIKSSCPNSQITATLKVTNACGFTTGTVSNISILEKPTADFAYANPSCTNVPIQFVNTTISGYSLNCIRESFFTWDFGDGSPIINTPLQAPQNINHTYANPGMYNITLTAEGYCGPTTKIKQICIEGPITPTFIINNAEGCAPFAVTTNNTTNISGLCSAASYLWEVSYTATNCGTAPVVIANQTTANASYSFTIPGTYILKLTMTNSCGSFSTTRQVIIKQPPTVSINNIPDICATSTTTINPTATITNCGTQAPTYAWSFPSGSPATASTASPGTITYATSGSKTISLTVTNECGVSTMATRTFIIKEAPALTNFVASQTICSGQPTTAVALTADLPGTTFVWTATGTTGINGFTASGSGTSIPVQTITTSLATPGTVTYTVTPTLNGCPGIAMQHVVTVNPAPLITTQPAPSATCFGGTPPQLSVAYTGGSASPVYEWYSNTINSTTGATIIGGQTTNTYQPSGSVIGTVYYFVKILFGSGGCASITSTIAKVDINAVPVVVPDALPVCSGLAFSHTPVNGGGNTIPTGTTYSWTAPTGTGFSGGSAQTNQNSISQTLTNTTNTPVAVTYTVTPKSGTCTGAPFQLTVTLNPTAVIPQQTATVCGGTQFIVAPVNNGSTIVPAGTLYSWGAPTVTGGLTGGQSGTAQPDIRGTLVNPTAINRTATYTVTPVSPDGNCTGNPFTVVVTVQPTPLIADLNPIEMCSGSTLFLNISNVPPNVHPGGTTFSWALPSITPAGSVTGAIAGNNATSFIPTLTNSTNSPATVVYTITPKSGSCTGPSFTITVTVNPRANVDDVTAQTLCNGTPTTAVTFTGTVPGTDYNWINDTPSIGLAASGSNTIPAFNGINNGNTPVTATITVTPVFGICSGTPKTFTITVNPAPAVTFSQANQTICSGVATTAVTLTSSTSGAAFAWTATTPAGLNGVVTGGTTTIPIQTLVNDTSLPITVTYIATASTTGVSCPGASFNYSITVNPVPVVVTPQIATVCGGTAFNVQPVDGSGNRIPSGTTYSWSAPSGTGFSGGSAQTGQPSISQTLANTVDVQTTATYTVTPKTGNCSGTPFTVTITLEPLPILPSKTEQICSEGSFSITPVTTLPSQIIPAGTTYTWPIPVVTGGITGGVSGTSQTSIVGTLTNPGNTIETATYTITPLSGTCPGQPFTLVVTVNPKPKILSLQQADICSGNAFTLTPANGSGDVVPANTTYTWSVPIIAPAGTITGASANAVAQSNISQILTNTSVNSATATYTVTPKSGNCTGTDFQVTVTVNPVPTVSAIANQTLCNGEPTAAVTFTGAVAGTIFKWSNTNSSIGLAATGTTDIPSFSAINTGASPITATITVTPEINGCDGMPVSFTITVNPAPTVMFSQGNQTICSSASSTVVNLSSVTPSTTFTWTATVPAGITGAVTSGTNTIPVQQLINTTSSALTVTYTATATTVGVACPGAPAIYTITVNPVPFVNAPQTTDVCSGTAAGFTPPNTAGNNIPSGTTYTWTAPTGTGFTGGSAQNVPQTSFNQTLVNTTLLPVTATYMITPEFNNCPGVTFQLTVTINPKAILASTAATICTTGTFNINPATIPATAIPSGTTYSWGIPVVTGGITGAVAGSGTIITGTLVNPTIVNQTATYTVIPLSPLGNCSGDPFNIMVTVSPALVVTSVVSNYNGFEISTAGANDGAINLTTSGGSGSYTYVWSGPGGFNAITEDVTNLGPGNYTVTISDGLCDPVVLNFQIDEPLPLIIQEVLASHVNLKCFGDTDGVIEVEITQVSIAPFDYVIKIQGGAVIESVTNTPAENYVFDNLPAGTYDVIVTDANGTVKQLLGITITQPANALAITNFSISDHNGFSITCTGANNGSIAITIGGGTPAYSYSWTGPNGFTASTEDIQNLAPGSYTVEVNDTTGICKAFGTYIIIEPSPITFTNVLSSFNGFEISCFGYNDGSIDIQPAGGTGNYSYNWSGPNGFTATTQDINTLFAGTYTLIITDSNGCINNSGSFILNQPSALTITNTKVDILCFGAATGSINATVTGGNPIEITPGVFDYNYSWSGPNGFTATTPDITNVPAGSYTLTVTDVSGCSQQSTILILQPTEINIQVATTPITCYGDDNATITVTLSGGTAPYTIAWSDFGAGLFRDNLGAGNYLITVTDAFNCIKTLNVTIPQAPLFTVNPIVKQITCFGANDGSINLNFAGGVPPITFAWTDNPTAGVVRNNLGPGTYIVNISDGQPCSITRTFTIIEPQQLVVSGNVTHAFDCNNANSGAINLLVAGGSAPFTFNWSNGATTEDLTNIPAGNYQVVVTDANGCSKNLQFSVNRQPPLVANVRTVTDFDCDTKYVKQTFVADVSGGVPPYSLSWSSGTVSGPNNEFMETTTNGTVILDVTDGMGCSTNYTFNVDIPELGTPSFTAESYAYSTFGIYSIVDPIQFTNTATGDYISVAWDFGDGSVSSEENPVHSFVRAGDYVVTLTVTYPFGCIYKHIITLMVDKGYELIMPTAFTPNNDVINDNFSPVFKGLKSVRIDVYSTWGEMIYSEEGTTLKGWDGTIKGLNAENGNYYYRVSAQTFYGTLVTQDGPFLLIK